ncbi:MAG: hypothetical protein ABIK79_13215, partial [Chloroflexota bacterium]
MLFVLEMIMLMVGIRVLLKGTLPRIPFVRPRYRLEKHAMKLLGVVLVIPIPLTIVGSVLLSALLGLHAVGLRIGKLRFPCLGRSIEGFVRHRQTRMGAFIVATHGLVMHTG